MIVMMMISLVMMPTATITMLTMYLEKQYTHGCTCMLHPSSMTHMMITATTAAVTAAVSGGES